MPSDLSAPRAHDARPIAGESSDQHYQPEGPSEERTLESFRTETEHARRKCPGPAVIHANGLRECLGGCGGDWAGCAHAPGAVQGCSGIGWVRLRSTCWRCRPPAAPAYPLRVRRPG
ncbi:MAG: hypothetical protein QOK40_514 [Miltoncostaeaceae bacterium]|nr:hypothetical protein [Miltoncostaeaceae bacterium]